MEEPEFEELINRCLSGKATEEELALLEKWLDHRGRQDPFNKLPDFERETIKTDIFSRITLKMKDQGRGHLRKATSSPVRAMLWYRAAAAILLASILSFALLKSSSPSADRKITEIHSASTPESNKKVILSDATIVWLKGSSSIVYPEEFSGGERKVKLMGEALFEVTKDPHHPFVIDCGDLKATVLGTSFNIKSTQTAIEVIVLTGKVALTSKGSSEALIVLPNEMALYDQAQNHLAKVMVEEKEKTAKMTGTEYGMRFLATRMGEIIQRIEKKFNVRVSVSDERLRNCTITADFTDQSLDRTLSMIAQTLEIEYERNNNEVVLRGVGCK